MEDGKLEKDIVVIKYPKVLDGQARTNVKAAFKKAFADFGKDVNILLLEEGMDISIIKKDM
jgi:hypothetical protein